ncbi:MAG: anti-sigma factor [Fulvivirga sp.]
MNIEEYISSGILEAYALGELSEKENQEVMAMLEKYPELKAELDQIEEGLERMAFETAVTPPSHVKERLFDETSIAEKPKAKVVTMESEVAASPYWRYIAAASVSLAVISSVLAYNYWTKWQSTETALNTLIAQNERVAEDYNQVNQQLDQIEEDLKVINNTEFTRVAMKGTDNAPNSLAYVYWNTNSQEVFLSVQNLKDLTEENQYQLWAIIDGAPVDAGVFNPGESNLLKMKNITSGAAAFAVTIEPKGGSENPSLETMQVVGEVAQG